MDSPVLMIEGEYRTHKVCRACGSGTLELLIDYGLMPLAGGFMLPQEAATRNAGYPLRLAWCSDCTLMQILDCVPPEIIFDQYSYASSTTHTLVEHFSEMGGEIVNAYSAGGKLVVEFGCNDGVLIKSLNRAGALAVGVDPSDVAKNASEREGWPLIHGYFTEPAARRILETYGKARIVVGNNVFAHVEDVHAILRGLVELLDDDGVFIIEVHYQGDFINKTQFDTVYHEHICYYSLTSLVKLFSRYSLRVVDVLQIPIHAGSIRVVAAREKSSYKSTPRVARMLENEKALDIRQFSGRVFRYRDDFRRYIGGLRGAGKRICAYGAAGRMTVLLNYCGLGADLIEYVVDMSPLRVGRIVPGVLVPIVSPAYFHDHPPEYAIMTAWNYEAEILEKEKGYLKTGGRFIVPLPEVRIIDGM